MTLKQLMTTKALICLIFGIPMLLFPSGLMALYGLDLTVHGELMARLYGGALLGNMMLTWYSRTDRGSVAMNAAILHLFVYDAINVFITFFATVEGIMSSLGWTAFAIYLFFAVSYGYYYVKERMATIRRIRHASGV